MKTRWLGLGLTAFVFACGGDDSTINPPADSGGNPDTGNNGDGGNNPDTSGNPDSSNQNDSGNFDPTTVSGLVLWLDAAKNITNSSGTSISKWGDRTSHKNDAAQGNTGRQPTAVASGINGLPTVHFVKGTGQPSNGQMFIVTDNADTSLQWGHQDFYIAVVARFDNDPADGANRGTGVFYTKFATPGGGTPNGVFFCGNIPNGAIVTSPASQGLIFLTSLTAGDSVSVTTKYWDNTAHMYTAHRTGTKLDMAVDGVSVGTSTSAGNDVSNPSTNVRIGADGDANMYRLDGDISEEMAVKGTLSASDQAGLEGYLKAKYAL